MKYLKYFVLIIVFFLCINIVIADVSPYYTSSLSPKTIGFLQVPQKFEIHLYPREDSMVLENVKWNRHEVNLLKSTVEPHEIFSVFKPSNSLAYCMVIDEQEDWYKIIYDKSNGKTGWVKAENPDDFMNLRMFVAYYGKKYGLEYMKNVDYHKRGLYSGAYQESQKIDGFTMIKSIKLNKISGNWALVTVTDFGNKIKIGYIRWREDNGIIIVFPKI